MRNGKGRVAALAVVAVLGLGAAACSSSNETSTTSTTAAAGSTGTTAAPGTTAGTTKGTTAGTTPGTAMAAGGPVDLQVIETPYGSAVGTGDGLAVYTFDKEADGTIACVDACLQKWPAVLAPDGLGDTSAVGGEVTVVDRPDGTQQVAIDGHPVYHMADDGPGEANCQGVNGWYIVNPDGTKNDNETPA